MMALALLLLAWLSVVGGVWHARPGAQRCIVVVHALLTVLCFVWMVIFLHDGAILAARFIP